MPFLLRSILIYLGIYIVAIFFTFVSEVTYKKRAISDVRQDWKRIVRKTTMIFVVFVVASILWGIFGVNS